MPYDVRDLLGHWVKPASREDEMCPHPCCRGRRPHPDRLPVMLSRSQLRDMSERQLVYHLRKHAGDARAVAQITEEVDDRQRMGRGHAAMLNARGASSRTRAARRRAADTEYRTYLESEWSRAERQTRGYMLNRAGERAGIDPRSLWTAKESTVKKYASEELRRWFEQHPRVTRDEFVSGEAGQIRGARARRESRLYGVY